MERVSWIGKKGDVAGGGNGDGDGDCDGDSYADPGTVAR